MAPAGLTPGRRRALAAVAESILPSGEHPGARETGVARHVERAITTRVGLVPWLPLFEEGLDRLDEWAAEAPGAPVGAVYADLPPPARNTLLRRLQEASGPRGRACVDRLVLLCLEGFLGDPGEPGRGGNLDGLGWLAVGLPADGSWKRPLASGKASAE